MTSSFYTIGMAGHIDHGKTSLTKALTGVDTDRLKEEKERQISIEPGYAPLDLPIDSEVSIVDVPGHERFIRQMIAGVAGIDLVLLIIAGDEGVMPQTKEHLQILEFLGITNLLAVITKIDKVENELVELVTEDVKELLNGTVFRGSDIHCVDSLTGKGISNLKDAIAKKVMTISQRKATNTFRLPIDQSFTLQGHGTVVRGTIFEGKVSTNSTLTLLPQGERVKVRQIQVHNKKVDEAQAGQRAALNITGVPKDNIHRGNVLVNSNQYIVTKTVDIALQLVDVLSIPLKQRAPIKLYVGTAEALGKIVFFDRNELKDTADEVLCQIRLEEEIVVKRGDRFIVRRPTPVETIGGGWIIQPQAGKYRFGEETITMLKKQKESSPKEMIYGLIEAYKLVTIQQLTQLSSLTEVEIKPILADGAATKELIEVSSSTWTSTIVMKELEDDIFNQLNEYHNMYPMRIGISKAELLQVVSTSFSKLLIEYALNQLLEAEKVQKLDQYISNNLFKPSLPKKTEKIMLKIISELKQDALCPAKWEDYSKGTSLSFEERSELKTFLLKTGRAYQLTDDTILYHQALEDSIKVLKKNTEESFSLKEAKETLGVSRKYLVPFLELLDEMGITERMDSNRAWKS
ncbi:selenocysteine-specific translation elongation factor [Fredinandcohnia sp. 179-A 10B2 NHS]|uniref:selenocysteine-specific translation elongation factor n=1 Tax=Fredinandcohnia sp. 179-A 10B2 NHS TaxID=3235176 RepID=UPI0039A08CB2